MLLSISGNGSIQTTFSAVSGAYFPPIWHRQGRLRLCRYCRARSCGANSGMAVERYPNVSPHVVDEAEPQIQAIYACLAPEAQAGGDVLPAGSSDKLTVHSSHRGTS